MNLEEKGQARRAEKERRNEKNLESFLNYATPNHIWSQGTGMTFFALISQTSSVFVPLFLVLQSIINVEWKGIFYILFLVLCTWLYRLFTRHVIPKKINEDGRSRNFVSRNDYLCNMYTLPFFRNYTNGDGNYVQTQSVSTFVLVFTLAFIMSPMVELKDYNWGFVLVLIVLILLNICWGMYNTCTNFVGVLTSILFGCIFGVMCYGVYKEVLPFNFPIYFNNQSGVNTCKVRGNVKYTCDFDDPDDRDYIVS